MNEEIKQKDISKGRTEQLKRDFLENFPTLFTISATCKHVGIGRTCFYNWLADDRSFADGFKGAQSEALEILETECRRRAVEGSERPVWQGGKLCGQVREFSDLLLIFLMKAMDPGKYRENSNISIDNRTVEVKEIIYNAPGAPGLSRVEMIPIEPTESPLESQEMPNNAGSDPN
jgi:hypothetical protein